MAAANECLRLLGSFGIKIQIPVEEYTYWCKTVKRRELESRLKAMGWNLSRHGGKHDVWTDGQREVAVPRHREINEYTAKAILRSARGERG